MKVNKDTLSKPITENTKYCKVCKRFKIKRIAVYDGLCNSCYQDKHGKL